MIRFILTVSERTYRTTLYSDVVGDYPRTLDAQLPTLVKAFEYTVRRREDELP